MRERIAPLDNPRSLGDALKGSEPGEFWKYRIDDYRIIASIEDSAVRILVVKLMGILFPEQVGMCACYFKANRFAVYTVN
jgi:hypothetical protein